MMNHNVVALSNDDLYKAAPAIFAEKPFLGMSDHYKFIPTIAIVEEMRNEGFYPVMATQTRTQCVAKQGFQKHMLKFRQEKDFDTKVIVGGEVAEIVLVNAHDGSALFELLMGIFRFVCGNGMVVQSKDFGSYHVKHTGLISDLLETTFQIVSEFPKAFEQIGIMKDIIMTQQDQNTFAEQALQIKSDIDLGVAPSLLLEARREDDTADSEGNRSLWNTFNVVQENLIRGGLEGKSVRQVQEGGVTLVKERKTKTRAIKSVQEDLRLNRELWNLASNQLALVA